MRDGWVETKLLDVVDVLDRFRKPINATERESRQGSVPYYGANGQTGWIDDFLFDEELVLLGEDAIDFADPNARKAYLIDGPSWVNNHAHVLRAKLDRVESYFLAESLNKVDFSQYVSFGTRSKLTQASMNEIKITLPPLPEQKRIVDLISSVDSYIEALQQQLESARRSRNALVESQIPELSGSSLFSLKNLSTKIGSGATPRGGEEVYIETGVNLIRSQNVHDSNFVMRGLVAIEDSAAKALQNVTVEKDDVLINITGASVTRCCVVDSTILPARVNQHVAIIRSDKAKILPKYLVLVLTSNEVKGFLNDIAGTGSTRQALTKSHLEDLEIPVPSISKQTEIIEISDTFDTAISKSQIALDQAKILRSGLLNELLSGEHEIPTNYDKVMGAA
jgi:type I restriction enzyme S subunit